MGSCLACNLEAAPGLHLHQCAECDSANVVHAILAFLPKESRVEPLSDWTTVVGSLVILRKVVCWEIADDTDLNQDPTRLFCRDDGHERSGRD